MRLMQTVLLICFLTTLTAVIQAQPCTPPDVSATHWYPGDGSAVDIVGSNNGTLVNGATYGAGKVNGAFQLNGTNQYVNLGSGFNLLNFAVEAWVYVDATNTGHRRIVSKDNYLLPGTRKAFALKSSSGAGNDGKPSFVIVDGATVDAVMSPGVLTPGWHFIAGVRDSGVLYLYVDGALVATAGTTTGIINSVVNTVIGTSSPSYVAESFSGRIDEVTFYEGTPPLAPYFASVFASGISGKCKPAADVGVTVSASNPMPDNGTNVTYTVAVTNHGSDDATNVVVKTTLDPNLIPVSCVGPVPCSLSVATYSATIPLLTASSTSNFTIVATVSGCVADMTAIVVNSMVTSSTPDPLGFNNTASATVHNCDLTSVSNDFFDISSIAQSGSFTLTSTCSAWTIVSDAPSWLTAVPAAGSGGTLITFSATANGTGVTRTGHLTILPNNFTVTVRQGPGGPAYGAAGRVFNFARTGGISGVTMTFTLYTGACTVPAPVFTDAFGNWSQSGFVPGCYYKVTPTKAGKAYRLAMQLFNRGTSVLNFYQSTP